jgi:hypothetical protein
MAASKTMQLVAAKQLEGCSWIVFKIFDVNRSRSYVRSAQINPLKTCYESNPSALSANMTQAEKQPHTWPRQLKAAIETRA